MVPSTVYFLRCGTSSWALVDNVYEALQMFDGMKVAGMLGRVAVRSALVCGLAWISTIDAYSQASGSLGNGLSAGAIGRGGILTTERGDPLDAVEGNPAGLAGLGARVLDVTGVGIFASGRFQNAANSNGRLSGVAGALPYGALAMPLGGKWSAAVAFTPEILMKASWRYVDAPGTAGATYGLQTQETQIVATRTSAAVARTLGSKWAVGGTLGLVYNTNDLNAPYIFQQQPQLQGLKVLLSLNTHGLGVNGSLGAQWQPSSRVRVGAAWKSATSIHTQGDASGTASAQFAALGIAADPVFRYRVNVENHLPQAVNAGIAWQQNRHLLWKVQGDFTGWRGAFKELPIKLTGGTNATINSVAGSSTLVDAVPLNWKNQGVARLGLESPVGEHWTLRAGYSYMSNPVPSATLLPLTAAIMQQAVAAGAGWAHGRWRWDAAYQAQLPATQTVGKSSILAGEYDNSRLRLMTQSVTVSARVKF